MAYEYDKYIQEIVTTHTKDKILTSNEISDLIFKEHNIKVSDRTIRTILNRLQLPTVNPSRKSLSTENFKYSDLALMIDSFAPNLNQPLKVIGDRIISSDWHIPSFSVKWFEILMAKAKKYHIKTLDIAGDFINLDSLSTFYEKNPTPKTPAVSDELNICKMVVNEISGWFDHVLYSIGNHEKNRFMRAMHNGLAIDSLIKLMTDSNKWQGNNLPYYYVNNIRVTHPKTYRQVKLSTATALSYKYGCPVLQAHGHFLSLGYNANGQVVGDTGGLMDKDRTQYLFDSGDTTHPCWNNGFMVYKNKQIIPYGEGIGE